MQKIDDGFWLTLGLYELNKSLALVDQRSPASRDDMTANQALVEFAFKKRRNKAKAQTRQHLLTCFQFAAREDAANGLEMAYPRSWTRWHMRGTIEETRLARHSCIRRRRMFHLDWILVDFLFVLA